jgi:phosphohistidine swiveling domain-containing protein
MAPARTKKRPKESRAAEVKRLEQLLAFVTRVRSEAAAIAQDDDLMGYADVVGAQYDGPALGGFDALLMDIASGIGVVLGRALAEND